jgi:hypothetical protein
MTCVSTDERLCTQIETGTDTLRHACSLNTRITINHHLLLLNMLQEYVYSVKVIYWRQRLARFEKRLDIVHVYLFKVLPTRS